MKIKRNVLFLGILLVIISYVVNVYGMTDKNSVSVNIKYNIVYAKDGKKMIEVGDVLIRDKDIYISLEDLQEVLGDQISFQNNTVNVNSKSEVESSQVLAYQKPMSIDKAKIINIDMEERTITIVPYNEENEPSQYMILEIAQECEMIYKELDKSIPFNMLAEGMIISAQYDINDNALEESYSKVIKIMIIEDKSQRCESSTVLENVEIVGLYKEKGYIKVAYINKDNNDIENQIIIHIDNNTNIRDEKDKAYVIEDLEIGQKIKVITNGILTQSVPPQTLGLDIIIIDKTEEIKCL